MGLVRHHCLWSERDLALKLGRARGSPPQSEFTVAKVDAYNDINKYLAQLTETSIRKVEDVVEFNDRNTGTEGANAGDIPAFPSGQVLYPDLTLIDIADDSRITSGE